MPGNEFGDRVHNFFAQDNSLQGQHQPQVVEGNWPVLNNNFWVGNQRQTNVLSSNNKSFNLQESDLDRGQGSYPFHVTHGLNFSQSNLRADYAKSQSLNEQPNLNGYMYENQFHQSRQNEGNFLAVGTDSEPQHLINSRGLSVHELQQGSGTEHQAKTSVRSETSEPSVSFDLFGGQQQMSHQHSGMLQPEQRQHPGLNKMQQQQQQQLMIRKMQDLQRQQQLMQLDLRQQNLINQVSPFAKQASGSHTSTLVNGNSSSEALPCPWTSEVGTNWLNHGSATMQGSSSGLVFPQNLVQTQQRLVDLVPQQVDQSLYGVPVSSSRGLTVNQYSQMVTDRSPVLPMSTSSNSLLGNYDFLPDQSGKQEGTSSSRQKFQNETVFGHASSQALNTGINDMGGLRQVNSIQRNAPQDFLGRQDLALRPDTPTEKSTRLVSSRNEVALDPDEEKILFGSDDNIWAAFGKAPNLGGGSGNLFDNGNLLNGLPSIQSGSWSALMQSAVAETSSSDVGPQEEWSGLIVQNIDGCSANPSSSMHRDSIKRQSSLANESILMPSALSSGSIPPPDDINTNNVMGLNLLRHKFQNEPGQRLPNEVSQRYVQSLEEVSQLSNGSPLTKPGAEGSQIYGNASQHSLEAERNTMTISSPWAHGQSGIKQQSNGRNAVVSIAPGGDRVLNILEAEKLSQNSQSNQLRAMQGEIYGSSLWKSNSVSSSAIDLGAVRSTTGNPEANRVVLGLNDTASVANCSSVGVGDETNPFAQNSYILNQWKNVNPSTNFQGGEDLGRMLHQAIEHNQGLYLMNNREKEEVTKHEMENCHMKENSTDSHRSNLSQHTSGGLRESGLSDASDSRSLPLGKQKSINQLSKKVSISRKFQYHPMGNLDEDVEPSYGLKRLPNVQTSSQQSSHFDQSKVFVHFPINSKVIEKGQSSELQRHKKSPNEEPSHDGFPGCAPNMSVSFSRPFDSSSKASSSGQNMLELLPMVDQSRDHGAMTHLSSFECNMSAQLPEAEKSNGSVGHLQQNQSSVYQGFGLQLGPPSQQRSQIPDHSVSSQKAQGTVNSMPNSHATVEMGEKGQQMVPISSVQSLPFRSGEFQAEVKNNRSVVPPRHGGNDKMPGNFQSAFSSGSLHVSQLQNQQITRLSGKMMVNQHIDSSFSQNVSDEKQRGTSKTILPDAPGNIQPDNLAFLGATAQRTGPNDVHERVPSSTASNRDPMRTSPHFSMHGISHQGSSTNVLHNMRSNIPTHQHTSSVQYQKASSQLSELSKKNIVESSSAPLTQVDMNVCKGGNLTCVNSPGAVDGEEQRLKESTGRFISSVNIEQVSKMKESLEKASSIKDPSGDSPANLASTQKNIEAFGRSLKPNSFSHQNYALLNQMRVLKDAESDPNFRVSKRMKPDNVLDVHHAASKAGQQNEQNVMVGDSASSTGIPSEDSRMRNFCRPADTLQINTSQHGNVASQGILAPGGNVPQSNSPTDYTATVRADYSQVSSYSQVSPQMAPSWFNQYGTFKNGNMHGYDAQKVIPSRPGEPPFTLGKSPSFMNPLNSEDKCTAAPTDACQVGSTQQTSTPTFVGNGHLSSPHPLQLDVASQHLVILGLEKLKKTPVFHPWHKEISDGSLNPSTLSIAEAEWNKVVNRLTEKVEDDVEFIEDGSPLLRSKRRLILTTQLMQQLFPPPPTAVLSADASSNYESMTYAVSRSALGDACSAVSCSNDLDLSCDGVELLSTKGCKNGDRSVGKVMEDLMGTWRRLENDFLRLEKSASIMDMKLESQDLEKFSVINRFAKFHGRGHTDNAETASSDAAAPTPKPWPQRYVTALPMPRNLPDRVQCQSL